MELKHNHEFAVTIENTCLNRTFMELKLEKEGMTFPEAMS